MRLELKRAIAEYIQRMDPDGDVVVRMEHEPGWGKGRVVYNWHHLRRGRECGQWVDASDKGAEELVRAYLVVKLIKELGYPPDRSIDLEEFYSMGHPSRKEARLDIRVGDKRDPAAERSYMLIECKSPERYEHDRTDAIQNQLFRIAPQEQIANGRPVAYLVYYTLRWEAGALSEDLEVIDFGQYQRFEDWDSAGQPRASTVLPASYGVAVATVYVAKDPETALAPGEKRLDRTKEPDFFRRLRVDLHNKLWGGSTEYNYVFKNLSRLLLAKIYDEFTTDPGQPYRFQIRKKVDTQAGTQRDETPRELFDRLDRDLVKPSTELLGYTDHERRAYGIEEEYVDPNKVAYVVAQLQGVSVVDNVHARNGDILGDFFEGIISEGYKQDRGTFFTHKNIVYFILYGLCLDDLVSQLATSSTNPRLPLFCDPACGSGTFLMRNCQMLWIGPE